MKSGAPLEHTVSLCSPFSPSVQPFRMSIIYSKTTVGPGSVCLYVHTQDSTLAWAMFFLIRNSQGHSEGAAVRPCLTRWCCNLGTVFRPVYLTPGQGQAWPGEPLISGAASPRQENMFGEDETLGATHKEGVRWNLSFGGVSGRAQKLLYVWRDLLTQWR